MKTLYTLSLLVFITTLINAQIPGGNFETWQTATFEYPDSANWTIYDERTSPDDVGLLEKSSNASDGSYAIKFNTYGTYDFGYVVYGQVGDDGPAGGIPFADNPKHVTISYKCNMAAGDSAGVWVCLYSNGSQLTDDQFKVGGIQSVYKDTTFTLSDYTEVVDSLMFAVVPCDPFVEEIRTDGNEVYFDNVRFDGTNNVQIPDNSFEIWASKVQDYTEEMHYIRALCEKSDDTYSGNFAMKMTTQNVEWDDDDEEIDMENELNLWGKRDWVEVSNDVWEPRITGGLPVHARKDTLVFYYKYIPPAGVIDTAELSLCFEKDSLEVINYWNILLPTNTYTKFEVPYDLDNTWIKSSVEADSMILALASSKWRNNWLESDTTIEGSSLYIDYMYFKSQLYSVSATAGSNGVVSPVDTSIILGDSLVFTITPDDGYGIDSVSYNGDDISDDLVQSGSDFTYTADSINENGSLYVDFKIKSYAITVTAGANGVVSPTDTTITHSDTLTFTITPDDGYEIDSVSYNGDDISDDLVQSGSGFTYTVNYITGDGSLYVSFKVITGRENIILTKDKISIYPNPVTDILYITGTTKESIVQFISVTGAVVYQKKISGNSSLDVSHIPAGLYFVKINNKVQCKLFKH